MPRTAGAKGNSFVKKEPTTTSLSLLSPSLSSAEARDNGEVEKHVHSKVDNKQDKVSGEAKSASPRKKIKNPETKGWILNPEWVKWNAGQKGDGVHGGNELGSSRSDNLALSEVLALGGTEEDYMKLQNVDVDGPSTNPPKKGGKAAKGPTSKAVSKPESNPNERAPKKKGDHHNPRKLPLPIMPVKTTNRV